MGLQADTWEESVYSEDGSSTHMERHYHGEPNSCVILGRTYDTHGFLLESQWFDHGGKLQSRDEYSRDENGLLLQRAYQLSDGSIEQRIYEYDENGNEIYSARMKDARIIEERHAEYEYDESGRLTKSIHTGEYEFRIVERNFEEDWVIEAWFWPEETEWDKQAYERDKEGRITRITYLSLNQEGEEFMTGYTVYAYNKQGNEILCESFSAKGEPFLKWEYVYDADGQTLLKEIYEETEDSYWRVDLYENDKIARRLAEWDGGMEESFYIYDAAGNKIMESTFRDGRLSSVKTWAYHSNGVSSLRLSYDENGELRFAEREETDLQGRTLQKICYSKP